MRLLQATGVVLMSSAALHSSCTLSPLEVHIGRIGSAPEHQYWFGIGEALFVVPTFFPFFLALCAVNFYPNGLQFLNKDFFEAG